MTSRDYLKLDLKFQLISRNYRDITRALCCLKLLWLDCLFNNLFWPTTNNTWWLYIAVPLWGETTNTGGFPTQRASNVESVSMSWYHEEMRTSGTWFKNKDVILPVQEILLILQLYYLNNGISYTGKTSLYWIRALDYCPPGKHKKNWQNFIWVLLKGVWLIICQQWLN